VGVVRKWRAERACCGKGGAVCLEIGGVCKCTVMHAFVGGFMVEPLCVGGSGVCENPMCR
jgi:hypothetical protein